MNLQSRNVLENAMQLSPADRAEVVVELIASLDGDADEGVTEAWNEEIDRRARRALAGESGGTAWQEVRERVERKLGG